MDDIIFYMDNINIHLDPYKRLFPGCPRVSSIGYMPNKTNMINHGFISVNFSFILKGKGTYGYEGVAPVEITPPCVLTQWPGTVMHYGPPQDSYWEELYIIYMPDNLQALQNAGYINPSKRWWNIGNITLFNRQLNELRELVEAANNSYTDGMADRLDRLCELLLLESLISADNKLDDTDKAIFSIKSHIENHCLEDLHYEELALSYGLSISVFRRRWEKHVGMPPHRFCIEMKISKARRLLIESNLSISEIAIQLGYDDPLYFSRKFRQVAGICASDYRKKHSYPYPHSTE